MIKTFIILIVIGGNPIVGSEIAIEKIEIKGTFDRCATVRDQIVDTMSLGRPFITAMCIEKE